MHKKTIPIAILALLLLPSIAATPTTMAITGTLTLGAGENYPNDIIEYGNYLYAGTNTTPAQIIKLTKTPTKVSSLTLSRNYLMDLDEYGGNIYGITYDGYLIKANPSTMTETDSLSLGVSNPFCLKIYGSYAYIGTRESPQARIVKVNLATFAITTTLILKDGEANCEALDIEGSNLQAAPFMSPITVANISLATFTELGNQTFPLASEINSRNVAFDGEGYSYYGNRDSPAQLIQFDNSTGNATQTLNFSAGYNICTSLVFSDSMYATFYTAPGRIARIYVVDSPPSVSTSAASSITPTSATLNGVLSSMGTASSVNVYFEYGPTASYGSSTVAQAKTSTGAFSASISGLTDGQTYHFRAVAIGNGTDYGDDASFVATKVPFIITGTDITTGIDYAILEATISNLETNGNLYFKYGTTNATFEYQTPNTYVDSNGQKTFRITDLAENTTYFYQALIYVDGETYSGDIASFTTKSSASYDDNASRIIDDPISVSFIPFTNILGGMFFAFITGIILACVYLESNRNPTMLVAFILIVVAQIPGAVLSDSIMGEVIWFVVSLGCGYALYLVFGRDMN